MTTRIRKSPSQIFPLVRHLSYFLTTHLLKTAITPNQITLLSLIFGLLCGACFISGSHFFQIAGAIFFILSYVMDNCDGEIARIKNMSSEFGAKFDDIVDWFVDSFFFLTLGYGVSEITGHVVWLLLGIIAACGALIDYIIDLRYHAKNKSNSITREQQAEHSKKPQNKSDWLIYIFHKISRADFCFIVFLLSIFNLTYILLPFAAIGAQIYWITDLFERARGYRI